MSKTCFRIILALSLAVLILGCSRDKTNAEPEAPKTETAGKQAEATPEAPKAEQEVPKVEQEAEKAQAGTREPEAEQAPGAEEPKAAPVAPARDLTVAVGEQSPSPTTPMGTVDVSFTLPAGWVDAPAFGENRWGPEGVELAVGFALTCNGQCSPGAVPENLNRAFEGLKDSAARPNLNTGDPVKDAVRAQVEVVTEKDLPGGRMMALKVTYSAEVLASGPYRPQVRALCAWHRPGDEWFVTLSLWAALAEGEAALPALEQLCSSVKILGPTLSPAEKLEPLVLTSEGFNLSALPQDAYTVDSANSEGKPSVILLTRPVVLNNIPIAPIGRIYVEYNNEPITIRDIFTAEDLTFTVDGVEVVCLHRQPLRVDKDGNPARCILARETGFQGFSLQAFSEATFAGGGLVRGVLAGDGVFPEATCKAGTRLELDPANRGLSRCTLANPLDKDAIHLPAGADVKWKETAVLFKAAIPKDAVLKVGDQEYPGPGDAVFKDGAVQSWDLKVTR